MKRAENGRLNGFILQADFYHIRFQVSRNEARVNLCLFMFRLVFVAVTLSNCTVRKSGSYIVGMLIALTLIYTAK